MQECHNLNVTQSKLSFKSFDAFLRWKEEEEVSTSACYVQRCQARVGNDTKVFYFYCNRSGFYIPKGDNKRSLKTHGTSKLNCYCTSHLKAKHLPNGSIEVDYCSTHHNHVKDISHLALPRHVKLLIATKIQQGVAVDRIMDDVRESIRYGDVPDREHLITTKDVQNIKKSMNMRNIQKHHSDPASVQIWVSQLRENDSYNPVLYFKQQGDVDESGRLEKDDFLLCIQSDFQLKQFGNMAICMDATHGTNQYHFLLITVLIIDEFGEGIPVAWAISSRETKVLLQVFLEAVHERSGDLTPTIFMSDDAIQYWNAWKAAYGENSTKKYLCSWHVDKSWRNALARHIENVSARAEVYAKLRVLMVETSERELMRMVGHLMSYLTINHPQLAEYFRNHYLHRIQEWSSHHRIGTLVNTNMHVEAFHRVLKYVYLHGKQNKRLDSLLHAMLKIARDKWFERLLKCTKGKSTYRIADLNRRHEKALDMINNTVVECISHGSWKVCPSDSTTNHVVEKQTHNCRCSIKCRQCGVCPELFTCSCVDYALHSTACKHIHLVCLVDRRADSHADAPGQQPDTDANHSPVDSDANHPLVDGDANHPLVDSDASHPPVDGDASHPLVDSDANHPPVDGDANHPLVDSDANHPPVDGDASHPPVDGDASHPLVDSDASHPLVDGDASHPLVDSDASHPPVDGDANHPLDGDANHPPVDGDANHPPVDSDTNHPPVASQQQPNTDRTLKRLRERIITGVNEIQMSAQLSNCVTSLSAALDHLHSAKLILKSEATLKIASSVNSATPYNVKISTQRYHSKKKKRRRSSVHTLLKPTEEEVKRIKLDLLSNTCSACFLEEPQQEEGDGEILWVECSMCRLWFHVLCVEEIDYSDNFVCAVCKR